ncbi:unnamed protein product [Rotaria sordida]|uniref:Uncharacterized protein n=1 Tax=Rotaria sordida TaxID=392033 RepID=A0A815J0V8_9BILA|nr:unnamed protein product [Rotaria sordida]CAF1478159.1 unnamed protein product [Rotaria sordida]CAF3932392.1 unnamed protein product [Rotaria sordida]CAF4026938.1 unnamed protein product [Rotaria sordida]
MNSLSQRHLSILKQLRKDQTNVTIQNLIEMFNGIVSCLNAMQNRVDIFRVLSSICNDLSSVNTLKLFDNVDLLKHEFFLIIGRIFEMLLTKARYVLMTKEEEECFHEISYLITNLCLYKNKPVKCFYTADNELLKMNDLNQLDDQISYQKIFLMETLFKKLSLIINNDLSVNDYHSYHVKYKALGRLIRLCTKLNDINCHILIDPVLNCLRSNFYLDSYQTLDLCPTILTPKQLFFIHDCPEFIRLRGQKRQDEISNLLCKLFIKYFVQIFEQHLSKLAYDEDIFNLAKIQAISWHVEFLNHFALTPKLRVHYITGMNEHICDMIVTKVEQYELATNVQIWLSIVL